MSNVIAHAATSPGEPHAPIMADSRDPDPRDVAQSVIGLLTRLGGMQ